MPHPLFEKVSRPLFALVALGGAAHCGGGERVTLGLEAPSGSGGESGDGSSLLPLRFEGVTLVAELSSRDKDDNPTLTADELLLCFTSDRAGSTGDVDVWCAVRGDNNERFDEPEPIAAINSEVFETSPALSLDGLSLWFGSQREGGLGGSDIYVTTRTARNEPWSTPALVPELNSSSDDIPRPPAMGSTVMPLGSRRTEETYWTYFAERDSSSGTFQEPELLEELTPADRAIIDGQLSEDGLLLLYSTIADDSPSDLFAVERNSLDEPFGQPVALEGINTEFDDRDPWLSPDGNTLYFASDRAGDFEIYRATRVR